MSDTAVKEPSVLFTTFVSLLVHGALIVIVIFLAQHKPLPEVVAIETSLAGAGDLAGAKAQIAQAYAKNQASQAVVDVPDTPTTSSSVSAYQDDLSARERAYQAQMDAYAKALDNEMMSEFAAQQDAFDSEQRERQREVNDLKKSERSNDDIAKENRKELDKPKPAKSSTSDSSSNSSRDDDDHTPSTPSVQGNSSSTASSAGSGSSSSAGTGSSGVNKNAVIGAIKDRIERNWSPESGLKGKTLTVTIQVDSHGALQGIRTGSGDKALQVSLESAIRASAPFPEASGVMTSFTIRFYAD